MICPDLQRAYALEQAFLQVPADAHDFTGRFHLRGKRVVRLREFIERETRKLGHHIIQRRLKRRRCIGDPDLVQCHSNPDLG